MNHGISHSNREDLQLVFSTSGELSSQAAWQKGIPQIRPSRNQKGSSASPRKCLVRLK
jgi:hypothetical protein